MERRVVWMGLFCTLVACTPAKRLAPDAAARESAASPATDGEVRWYGALHAIIHEGRTQSSVTLGEAMKRPHAWGVGALEGLHGEVTIVDGTAWLARPSQGGAAQVSRAELSGADRQQGAALLVLAHVETWEEIPVVNAVAWSELDKHLETELRARNVTLDRPVALRVEGPVAQLKWHVVDGSKLAAGSSHADHARSAVSGTVPDAQAQLVGFFSKNHQGVFTHAGAWSHFHALLQEPLRSGHVDGVELRPGARILFARNKPAAASDG